MDRQRMKRNLCYGLLIATGAAVVAGVVFMLVVLPRANAAAARLPDGARIAIDGRAGAAEWSHCLSQRFEKNGLLRLAWDADYVYGMLAEDLPARKTGTNGDLLIVRMRLGACWVYAYFNEGWGTLGPELLRFDATSHEGMRDPGRSVPGFIGQPASEAVGPLFRCTNEFRMPLAQLGLDAGTVSSITMTVMRIHNPSLPPAQEAD